MQISFPSWCVTGGQVKIVEEHKPTVKYYASFCFLSTYSVSFISYIVGWIQTCRCGP